MANSNKNVKLKDLIGAGVADVLMPASSADLKPIEGHVSAQPVMGTKGYGIKLVEAEWAAAKSLKDICTEMDADPSREWTCALALGEVEDSLDTHEKAINLEFATFDAKANRKRKLSKDEQAAYKKAMSKHRARAAKLRLLIWAVRNGHWTGLEKFTFDTILSLAGEMRRKEKGIAADVDSDRAPTDKQVEAAERVIDNATPPQTQSLFERQCKNVLERREHLDERTVAAAEAALAILGKKDNESAVAEIEVVKAEERLAA